MKRTNLLRPVTDPKQLRQQLSKGEDNSIVLSIDLEQLGRKNE
jgi:hypothetical protein